MNMNNRRPVEGAIIAVLVWAITHFSDISGFEIKMDSVTVSCSKTIQSIVENQ